MEEKLNEIEQMLMRGIESLRREMQYLIQQTTNEINADLGKVVKVVEERLGLKTGALGTTHIIDSAKQVVREMTENEKPVKDRKPLPRLPHDELSDGGVID